MKIRYKILFFLIVPLILAYVTLSTITLSILIPSFQTASSNISTYMLTAELHNIKLRNENLNELIELNFRRIANDIIIQKNYTNSIFNDDLPIKNYYPNFFGAPSIDSNLSIPSDGLVNGVNRYYSLWLNKYTHDETVPFYLNKSSIVDNIWRPMYESTTKYTGMYMGFADGTFRRFPYSNVDRYLTMDYICLKNNLEVIGYDPTCRSWYIDGISNQGVVKFSDPYIDANQKVALLSASHSINYKNGTFIGVISVSLSMKDLENTVLSEKIYVNGYNFLMNSNGNLIIYPNLKRDKLYSVTDPLYETNDFMDMLKKIQLNNDSNIYQSTFTKGSATWWITYGNIAGTNYIAGTVVPESDLLTDITNIKASINDIIIVLSVSIGIIIVVLTCISYATSNYISKKITVPINELTKVTQNIQKGELNIEMGIIEQKSSDIKEINNKFMNLIKAVRYANKNYQNENLEAAYRNYLEVKDMLTTLKNKKGLGAVMNNLGATVWKLEDIEDRLVKAEQYFELAIKNAEEFIENSKTDDAKNLFKIKLASRYMNLGQFYAENPEKPNYKAAKKMYQKSIKLNREVDNKLGEIITMGNLGLLYIQYNKPKTAFTLFNDAYGVITERFANNKTDKNAEVMQYAALNLAIYYKTIKSFDIAVQFINYALSLRPTINRIFKHKCLSELLDIYEKVNDKIMVQNIKNELQIASSKSKHVLFVLDCSGSMEGEPIKACRYSINDIMSTYINKTDEVSLIKFNTAVNWIFSDKTQNDLNELQNLVLNRTHADGGTAFYDALIMAASHVIDKNKINDKDQWIIALTDGEDNKSRHSKSQLMDIVKKNQLNVIIIAHGRNIDNIGDLKDIISSSPKGILLKSTNTKDISEAFKKAIKIINKGYENIETI